jgi:hypothetical protein
MELKSESGSARLSVVVKRAWSHGREVFVERMIIACQETNVAGA